MFATTFEEPLTVLVGLGFPRQISSLLDAIRYLDEQPSFLRDEAFHATYGACQDALNGDITSDEARDILCALLRRRGTLLEDNWYDPIRVTDADRLMR
jgi:Protein of unknown function (DUF982)